MDKAGVKAVEDITESRPLDKRRTGFYNDLECYTVRVKDFYNLDQRKLNKQLGLTRKYNKNVL